jgi:hypothetical protein
MRKTVLLIALLLASSTTILVALVLTFDRTWGGSSDDRAQGRLTVRADFTRPGA